VDALFLSSLDEQEQLPRPFERARTELCYGERLRRARRKSDARHHLELALRTFEELGARPWAGRARSELQALGIRVPRRASATELELTPQELRVALAVREGATNREASAALFLSPKTIEAHLSSIYRKLGVRSRTELATLLARNETQSADHVLR
jgi:DNA-binding NarL/FixJ family response regulator